MTEGRCPWRPDQPCPWHPVGQDAEIVRLVALGWTDHAIGKAVGMSASGVGGVLARLCRMLGLTDPETGGAPANRARLSAWAGAHGYYTPQGGP